MMYKIGLLLCVTPIIAMIFNVLGLYSALVWYIPIFAMFIFILREIMVNKKNIDNLFVRKNIPIILYFFLSVLSCLLSEYKFEAFFGYNFEGLLTFISYLGFFYLGLKLSKMEVRKIYKRILLVAIILSLFMLLKNDLSYFLFNIPKDTYYFYQGPFDQFNHTAYYLLIVNVISIFMFINEDKKVLYFIINLIVLYTLVINDTFGVYIAYFLTLIMIVLYYILKKDKIKEILIVLLSFILVSCLTYRNGYNIVLHNIHDLLNDTNIIWEQDLQQIQNVGTNRGKLWIYGAKLIFEKPLLGYGFENIKYEYAKYDIQSDKPHNLILELAMHSGIPAMILYVFFIVLIIIQNLKKISKLNNTIVISLIIVMSYLTGSIVGNQTLYVAPYFYIFLGVLSKEYYRS